MQHFLLAEWGITSTVFYDTPPTWFHKASLQEQHNLFTRIAADLNAPMHNEDMAYEQQSAYSQHEFDTVQEKPKAVEATGVLKTDHNAFTHLVKGRPQLRADRPALVVSSTSWTVDEDFGVLLNAALQYEKEVRVLLCSPIFARNLHHVHRCQLWKFELLSMLDFHMKLR